MDECNCCLVESVIKHSCTANVHYVSRSACTMYIGGGGSYLARIQLIHSRNIQNMHPESFQDYYKLKFILIKAN